MIIAVSGATFATHAKKRTPKATIHGIDISRHNGKIDWEKVKKNHPEIKFVYIKATEGATWVDSNYKQNFKNARKKGLKVGSYHFFNYRVSAREQFNNFIATININNQDLIPMVDFEKYGSEKNARNAVASLKEFCQLVKDHFGVSPMIYTNERIYNQHLWKDFKKYHLFIANYKERSPQLKDDARYTIWQFSERGRIAGIKENVDLNRFHPDFSLNHITYSKKKQTKK
ncbi:MAG: glycoside hydrolase family 25 protein [Muribaculaceae bacterium]